MGETFAVTIPQSGPKQFLGRAGLLKVDRRRRAQPQANRAEAPSPAGLWPYTRPTAAWASTFVEE